MATMAQEKIKEILDKGSAKAKELLADDGKMQQFLDSLEEKLRTIPDLGDDLAYVPVFVSMVRAYVTKEYREVPTGAIMAVVAALLYFLSPIDIVPDAVPLLGLTDDAAVIVGCALMIKPDLDKFMDWRKVRECYAEPLEAEVTEVETVEE